MLQWDTLKEIGPHELHHRGKPVPGKMYEVELTSGKTILVWKSDDGQQYFCHGLTFGGKVNVPRGTYPACLNDVNDKSSQARGGEVLRTRAGPESLTRRLEKLLFFFVSCLQ